MTIGEELLMAMRVGGLAGAGLGLLPLGIGLWRRRGLNAPPKSGDPPPA